MTIERILCVYSDEEFQVDRLLSHLTSSDARAEVVLLAPESSIQSAKKLKNQYSIVNQIIEYPYSSGKIISPENIDISISEKINSLHITKAIIPITNEHFPLQFIPGKSLSDMRKYYHVFRFLWHHGIKHIETFDLNNKIEFHLPNLLDSFVNIHRGKRCFVVGNGPSLNLIDMSLLKNEITLGSNRCYLGYEDWGFSFTYWSITDRLQLEEHVNEWEENIPDETIKFFPFEYLQLLNFKNACPLNHHYDYEGFPKFSSDCRDIYLGTTVTYVLLQIAVIMGCNPIYLIGCDHRYPAITLEKKEDSLFSSWVSSVINYLTINVKRIDMVYRLLLFMKIHRLLKLCSSSYRRLRRATEAEKDRWYGSEVTSATHFHPDYAEGRKFVVARPERAEIAFECAANWAKENGVEILNATPDSALKVFPMVRFNDIFQIKKQGMNRI